VQDDPPEFLVDSDLVEGIRLLSDYGFSFDLTVTAGQLKHAIELVDRCPEVQFVLDHLGKPAIREGRLDPWRTHLERLAEREHVVCKLSGVLTEADLEEWATADVAPFIEHALECFGPDRLLFGGDWPVLRLAADYSTWVDLVETSIQSYSDIEQQKILRETARRVYDLA
jgi:L-fuconolactonase